MVLTKTFCLKKFKQQTKCTGPRAMIGGKRKLHDIKLIQTSKQIDRQVLQIPSSKSSTIATSWGDKGDDNEAQQGKEWDRYQSWQGHGLGQDPREEDEWFLKQKKFEQKRVDQRRREQNAVRAPGDSYCCCCCSSLLKLWGNFNFQTSLPLFQQITSWSIFQLDFLSDPSPIIATLVTHSLK